MTARFPNLDALVAEFALWLARERLTPESADELLLREGLTPLQRAYLTNFITRWDAAAKEDRL